jgi:hypothetical protein
MKHFILATFLSTLLLVVVDSQIVWNGNWAFNCDFRIRAFKIETTRGEDCGPRCTHTRSCTHFTWSSINGGTCWLQSTPGISKSDAFVSSKMKTVCGLVDNKIVWNGNWAFACDFAGGVLDLKNELTRGEDCGLRCSKTPNCTHFTWTPFNGGTCWMKSKPGVSKSEALFTNNNDMVCGVI